MKTLNNDTVVTSSSYYFLLDWNERDSWRFLNNKFGKQSLFSLTLDEYRILWLHATTDAFNKMGK